MLLRSMPQRRYLPRASTLPVTCTRRPSFARISLRCIYGARSSPQASLQRALLLSSAEAHQLPNITLVNLGAISRCNRCGIERAHCLANVEGAALVIERHVAAVEDVIDAEERDAALHRSRAGDGGVRVELPEIVERPLLQRVLVEMLLMVGRAAAELVEA